MADAIFEHPRLAAVYDKLEGNRDDLDAYIEVAAELDAERVLDLGCGTGVLALLLADRGHHVVGVDPAAASLEIARSKPGAERTTWILGDATTLPELSVDLVTMTGNVAQAINTADDWDRTLAGVHDVLHPGGILVFETRNPENQAWQREWTRERSRRTTPIEGTGEVESWVQVIDTRWPLVTFRSTFVFHSDGAVMTSDSTLRFRSRDELERSLAAAGFDVDEVREAPDRPGRELVFFARRIP